MPSLSDSLALAGNVDAPAFASTSASAVNAAPAGKHRSWNSARVLTASAALWFVTAVVGQLLFATYLVGFYGKNAVAGRFDLWNKVMPHGYVSGDSFGNLVIAMHLLLAVVVIVGGALQLTPLVRRRWPKFHGWNGRIYLLSAVVTSVGGLIMVWTRGTVGDFSQHVAISLNAVLIMACAALALRYALARRFDVHRRWAVRLFLVVSGVWFFRISLMFWIVVNQGPVGFDPDTFRGPALTTIAFAQYLVPLAIAELYFRAQRSDGRLVQVVMAVALTALSLLTASGIAAAAAIMWLPHL